MMTTSEWNEVTEFLETAEEGCFVENEGRTVEVVSMCGGKFLFLDKVHEVCGLTFEIWRALEFLKSGRTFVNGKTYYH